jgi:hypothetical protein
LLIYVLVSAVVFLIFLAPFFQFIQNKPGAYLSDPVLNALPAYDLSIPIFILIYGMILVTIALRYSNPHFMLVALATYCTINYFRIITIYLFTLEPPSGLILLQDPFVSLIAYENTFVKDLFFSGHIATLMVLVFPEPKPVFKYLKLAVTLIVAILLLIQHIHYTIDIVAAPFFSYMAYRLILKGLGK